MLINMLGITNSGGIEVADKMLTELSKDTSSVYVIITDYNMNILKLINKYQNIKNFEFKIQKYKSPIYRLYYENVIFRKIIKEYSLRLIYNFSGSYQFFFKIPQITKIHNLIFYSKKLDAAYRKNSQLILWARQVYLKRLIFKFMLSKSKHVEIQSKHVKSCLLDFINTREKFFYVKSDINVSNIEFYKPKQYDFSKKIKFLYIVGPHFEYMHKNFMDFTNAMLGLNKKKVDFEINITLTNEQLNNSKVWDASLNLKTNFLGYISDQEKMTELFCDNTILISTSIIETLGLHVIEGIKNGIITISPDEGYSNSVYGDNMFTYDLFNKNSLLDTISSIVNYEKPYDVRILSIQDDLKQSEMKKNSSILNVFNEVLNV